MPEITALGAPLTPEKISLAESQLGFPLPSDYREFLLKYNGCTFIPKKSFFFTRDFAFVGPYKGMEESTTLEEFYPLVDALDGAETGTVIGVRKTLMSQSEIGLPDFLIPIGFSDQKEILLCVHPSLYGHVFRISAIDISEVSDYATGAIAKYFQPGSKVPTVIEYLQSGKRGKIADSFTGFLKTLANKSNKPIF